MKNTFCAIIIINSTYSYYEFDYILKSEVVAVITFSIKETYLKLLLQLLLLNKEKNINRYRRIALGNEFKISYVFAVSFGIHT